MDNSSDWTLDGIQNAAEESVIETFTPNSIRLKVADTNINLLYLYFISYYSIFMVGIKHKQSTVGIICVFNSLKTITKILIPLKTKTKANRVERILFG